MNIYNMNNSEIELHFRESHILQPKQYNLSDTAKDQPGGHEVAFATPELVTQCIKYKINQFPGLNCSRGAL